MGPASIAPDAHIHSLLSQVLQLGELICALNDYLTAHKFTKKSEEDEFKVLLLLVPASSVAAEVKIGFFFNPLFKNVTKYLLKRNLAPAQNVRVTAGESQLKWAFGFRHLSACQSSAQIQSDRHVECFLSSVSHLVESNTD